MFRRCRQSRETASAPFGIDFQAAKEKAVSKNVRNDKDVNNDVLDLMKKYWPGALTIIFNRKECIPNNVTAGLDTVGIRMPSNNVARKLIEFAELPIAAPSANISGKPSGTKIEDIIDAENGCYLLLILAYNECCAYKYAKKFDSSEDTRMLIEEQQHCDKDQSWHTTSTQNVNVN